MLDGRNRLSPPDFSSYRRSDGMMKRGKRWNGALRMRQAVLHPLVWRTMMQKRLTQKRKGRRSEKKGLGSNSISPKRRKTMGLESNSISPNKTSKFRSPKDSLDSGVWEDLPDELIERILNRLPPHLVIPCRTVCKGWNAHIISRQLLLAPLSRKTVLVYFPQDAEFLHRPLTVYNAARNGWERHDMSFLHDGGVLGPYSLVAADRGLLCFCDPTWTKFVVCNPLSKQWTPLVPPTSVLPHIPGMQVSGCPGNYVLVGLVVNEEDGSYKLVLAGMVPKMVPCRRRVSNLSHTLQERQTRTSFVYNSRLRSWNPAPAFPVPSIQQDFGVWSNECPRRSVACEGKLYWSIVEKSDEDDCPVREIVRFDTKRGEWCSGPICEHSVQDLVALDGKALAMKLRNGIRLTVGDTRGGGLRGFYAHLGFEVCSSAWEGEMFEILDGGEKAGIVLTRRKIPKVLREGKKTDKSKSDQSNQYTCIGQGSSVFVMDQAIDGDKHGEWEMQGWNAVHYDSSTASCVRLPQLNTYVYEQFPLSWWTLQPSLAAFA